MRLGAVSYLARDYDEAIAWFTQVLGFALLEDSPQGDGKRWVRVAASEQAHTALLIAQAKGDQIQAVGQSAGGRVAYFLEVEDFAATHERLISRGVAFEEAPRHEPYGTVAVFRDLYGNRWDLLHLTPAAPDESRPRPA